MKLSVSFAMCFLAIMVFCDGLDQSEYPNVSQSPAELFKALEDRIRELEKSHQEFKDLKESHEKSQEELKKQVESLTEEVEKLKQGILENEGVGMLRPPVRGPPGKKGEMGDQGLIGSKGDRGEKGEKGPPGQSGSQGNSGRDGKSGEKGEKGPTGSKGDRGVSVLPSKSITSCSNAMEILPSPRSNFLCDFEVDGGGWTLIQKRSSGPKDEFNRTWTEYSNGFGSLDKNFWMGLENIRALTKNGDQELRIDLEDFEGNKRYAKYSSFLVSDASDFYRLSIDGYSGNAGNDMMRPESYWVLNGMQFTTKDKDNDKYPENCAVSYPGGWWFNGCFAANLNGLYREKGETVPEWKGIIWNSWKGSVYSLAKTEMKIRKRK